jgi:hypothetical protein
LIDVEAIAGASGFVVSAALRNAKDAEPAARFETISPAIEALSAATTMIPSKVFISSLLAFLRLVGPLVNGLFASREASQNAEAR